MSKKFMVIGVRGKQGFFSNFLHTLQYLHSSELEKRIPIVHWKGGIYTGKDGYRGVKGNLWEYYFNRVSEYSIEDINGEDVKHVKKYRNESLKSEPPYCWDYRRTPPETCLGNPSSEARIFVNNIINKYIVIREEIQKKIDDFYVDNIKGNNVLGVHLRFCNDHRHHTKNPLPSVVKSIHKYMNKNSNSKIFVATDLDNLLEGIKKEFGENVIYSPSKRSTNGNPLQYGCKPKKQHQAGGAKVGEEVIIDCKLLSMCSYLYHGISNVSGTALYFNSDIKSKCIIK